ncbi:hypothetical protein V2G26_016334 [Clonostachys chloroleuca]
MRLREHRRPLTRKTGEEIFARRHLSSSKGRRLDRILQHTTNAKPCTTLSSAQAVSPSSRLRRLCLSRRLFRPEGLADVEPEIAFARYYVWPSSDLQLLDWEASFNLDLGPEVGHHCVV